MRRTACLCPERENDIYAQFIPTHFSFLFSPFFPPPPHLSSPPHPHPPPHPATRPECEQDASHSLFEGTWADKRERFGLLWACLAADPGNEPKDPFMHPPDYYSLHLRLGPSPLRERALPVVPEASSPSSSAAAPGSSGSAGGAKAASNR